MPRCVPRALCSLGPEVVAPLSPDLVETLAMERRRPADTRAFLARGGDGRAFGVSVRADEAPPVPSDVSP